MTVGTVLSVTCHALSALRAFTSAPSFAAPAPLRWASPLMMGARHMSENARKRRFQATWLTAYNTIPFFLHNSFALSTESTPVLFLIGANSFSRTTSNGRQESIRWIISSTRVSYL